MSLHNKERRFQTFAGRRFLAAEPRRLDSAIFSAAISTALRRDFGEVNAAPKIIGRLIGANPRAVKNWLEGRNGPSGKSLVELCRYSDRVFESVAQMAGRERVLKAKKLIDARQQLRDILTLLDELETTAEAEHSWPSKSWPGHEPMRRARPRVRHRPT